MPHNNPSGINGYGAKHCTLFLILVARAKFFFVLDPSDDTLRRSLFQYAKEKLTVKEHLMRLSVEHQLLLPP